MKRSKCRNKRRLLCCLFWYWRKEPCLTWIWFAHSQLRMFVCLNGFLGARQTKPNIPCSLLPSQRKYLCFYFIKAAIINSEHVIILIDANALDSFDMKTSAWDVHWHKYVQTQNAEFIPSCSLLKLYLCSTIWVAATDLLLAKTSLSRGVCVWIRGANHLHKHVWLHLLSCLCSLSYM